MLKHWQKLRLIFRNVKDLAVCGWYDEVGGASRGGKRLLNFRENMGKRISTYDYRVVRLATNIASSIGVGSLLNRYTKELGIKQGYITVAAFVEQANVSHYAAKATAEGFRCIKSWINWSNKVNEVSKETIGMLSGVNREAKEMLR